MAVIIIDNFDISDAKLYIMNLVVVCATFFDFTGMVSNIFMVDNIEHAKKILEGIELFMKVLVLVATFLFTIVKMNQARKNQNKKTDES